MIETANKPQILELFNKSLNITIYDCTWIPQTARCIVLGMHPKSTGSIEIYELDGEDLRNVSRTETSSGVRCASFGATSIDKLLATGDLNGRLSLWSLDDQRNPIAEIPAHSGVVNTMDGFGGKCDGHGPPEIVTGGRDGCVRVFDVRQLRDAVASFEPIHDAAKRECWSVAIGNAYNDTERCVLAGYDNGDVKLFDLRTNKIRWEMNMKNGVCGVQFDRRDIEMNKFVVTCLESQFHIFDARTQHPQKGFAKLTETSEFKSTCWAPYHLPQNREIFAITHGDGTIALLKYHYPPQRKITGKDGKEEGVVGSVDLLNHSNLSSQPITCFNWNPDKEGLFVCGALDQCIRIGTVTKLNKV